MYSSTSPFSKYYSDSVAHPLSLSIGPIWLTPAGPLSNGPILMLASALLRMS